MGYPNYGTVENVRFFHSLQDTPDSTTDVSSVPMRRRRIVLDFDGVIHSYTTKWEAANIIPDPPVEGALDWLFHNVKNYELIIFSTRNHQKGAIDAMKDWLYKYFREAGWSSSETIDIIWRLGFHTGEGKPICELFVDDRAFCFEGTFPTDEYMKNFKPWNKRES